MPLEFLPTRQAAQSLIDAIRPDQYAQSRNHLSGAVTCLSPYITHGIVSLPEVFDRVHQRHPLQVQDKLVFEFGWREYFRHVWRERGEGIFSSLHPGPLPDAAYATSVPADIREGVTGVPVIDMAVQTLYQTGYLHNHARMWLASYVVHVRKVHWRAGADWLYAHLLDGDLASNHLSWQWVAGTGSHKPYLFNADNVARYAPPAWHSPGSRIDQTYEALDALARDRAHACRLETETPHPVHARVEPALSGVPLCEGAGATPRTLDVAGRDVWLLHPWNLGQACTALPKETVVLGVLVSDFHHAWPWSERRWRFVISRMKELADCTWCSDALTIAQALKSARSVRTTDDPHLQPWLQQLAHCEPAPSLFPAVERRCDSFSAWWRQATHNLHTLC